MTKIEVLLPTAEIEAKQSKLAPRVASLEGMRVGFIDHHKWQSMAIARNELEKVFTGEYGAKSTSTIFIGAAEISNQKKYMEDLKALVGEVDVVLGGLGY